MDEIDDAPIVQRIVSAADAPPLKTTGVSSIFAAGGERAADLDVMSESERALKVFEVCGRITASDLADAMGWCKQRAKNFITRHVRMGRLAVHTPSSGPHPGLYALGSVPAAATATAPERPQRDEPASPPPAIKAKEPVPETRSPALAFSRTVRCASRSPAGRRWSCRRPTRGRSRSTSIASSRS